MQTILQKLVIEPLCYCCCSRVFAGQGYVHPSAMFVDADACSDLLPSRHFSTTHCHHWTHNSKTIIDYVKVYQYIQWQPAPNNNDAPPTEPKKESSIAISKVEIAGFRCRNANRNTFGNKMVQPSFLWKCSWSIQWWWMLVTCDNKTEEPSMHPRNVDGWFI